MKKYVLNLISFFLVCCAFLCFSLSIWQIKRYNQKKIIIHSIEDLDFRKQFYQKLRKNSQRYTIYTIKNAILNAKILKFPSYKSKKFGYDIFILSKYEEINLILGIGWIDEKNIKNIEYSDIISGNFLKLPEFHTKLQKNDVKNGIFFNFKKEDLEEFYDQKLDNFQILVDINPIFEESNFLANLNKKSIKTTNSIVYAITWFLYGIIILIINNVCRKKYM